MANIESQKKRNRQNARANERNKGVRSQLKTESKKARLAIEAGDEGAADLVRTASRSLDRAASKGVLHKRTAARRKSRLAKRAAAGTPAAAG